MSPDRYRALAAKALDDAAEYRVDAVTADEPRRSMLLKWADQREADAAFYSSRADIHEDYERRHAPKSEAA